jgi:hypothetical protein
MILSLLNVKNVRTNVFHVQIIILAIFVLSQITPEILFQIVLVLKDILKLIRINVKLACRIAKSVLINKVALFVVITLCIEILIILLIVNVWMGTNK